MENLFLMILNMSLSSCFVILAVLLVRLLLRRLPKSYTCWLWAVVLFRLLCPFSLPSPVSLLPMSSQPVPSNIAMMDIPEINSGIPALDRAVNNVLPVGDPYSSVNPMQILLFIAGIVWMLGLLLLAGYAIFSGFLLRRRLMGARHLTENIYVAENLQTPFVFGLLRPRIYLPKGLDETQTALILCHERTHIRRKDHIVKPAAFLALCLHWFNPLVWTCFILLAKDLEMACDEAVVQKLGSGIKKDYSSSLLSLAMKRQILGGMPLAFGEGEVKGRIKNILSYKKPALAAIITAVVIVAAVCVGLALNPADNSASHTDPQWLEQAWEWRTSYTGDAPAVGNIIHSWYTLADASVNGMELHTENPPYGVTIQYRISTAGMSAEEFCQNYASVLDQNITILFSLVENLDYVELDFSEDGNYTWSRQTCEEQYGKLWPQSETVEKLQSLYEKTSLTRLEPDSAGISGALGDNGTSPAERADTPASDNKNNSVYKASPAETAEPGGGTNSAASATGSTASDTVGSLRENEDYQYLLNLFPEYYDWQPPAVPVEADLDGDGAAEQITAENLGYNGGDGGYEITVSRLTGNTYSPIPFPEGYSTEEGFPIRMNWDGTNLNIVFSASSQAVPYDVLASIYEANDNSGALETIKNHPVEIPADAVSGFCVVTREDGANVLVLKQYLTGPLGAHADRIGYGITELTLLPDDSWKVNQYYLPAN